MDFSTMLKQARIKQGMTQLQVAESMGMSLSAYKNWEGGNRQPSLEKLAALCQLLNVSADYLLGLSSE